MQNLRLFTGPLSMFGAKAHIAMLEKGLDAEVVMVPFGDEHLYQPKHPEVLRINPKQQVPVLIHGDLEIFDSTQIFEYLEDLEPEPALWPGDLVDRTRARLLEHKSDEVFFPYVVKLMGLQDKLAEEPATTAIAAISSYYLEMETQLTTGPWLAGPYSYADIALFMAQLFAERMSAPLGEATPNLIAWRANMVRRPAVAEALAPLIGILRAQNRPIPDFLINP